MNATISTTAGYDPFDRPTAHQEYGQQYMVVPAFIHVPITRDHRLVLTYKDSVELVYKKALEFGIRITTDYKSPNKMAEYCVWSRPQFDALPNISSLTTNNQQPNQ